MFPLLDRQVPHIGDKILGYLNSKDSLAARAVCREWKECIGRLSPYMCTCNQEKEGFVNHTSSVMLTWADLKKMFKMTFPGPVPNLVTMTMPDTVLDACSNSDSPGRIHVLTQRSIFELDIADMSVVEELFFSKEHRRELKNYTLKR